MIGKPWASHASGILAGLTSGATFLFGALIFAGVLGPAGPGASASGFAIGVMVTAGLAAVVASKPVRERVAGILHTDPDNPVHTLALVLGVILLFAQELPFLIIALAGVGLWTRRSAIHAADRLGVVRPAWWQITLALAAAGVFFAFSQAVVSLSQVLTPQVAHNVDVTTQHVFSGLNNPIGIAAIALLPAICEEILFRGALQPRLGLVVTALLFTSIHTQYSISFDTLAVFLLALGLGLIRKYTNTTTSAVCHATYNLLVSIGVGGDVVAVAIAAEVALVVTTAFAVWSLRRRRVEAISNL